MVGIVLKQGDFGFDIVLQAVDSSGLPRDLTLYTYNVKIVNLLTQALTLNKALVAVDVVNGKVKWTVAQADAALFNTGTYVCEMQLFIGGTYMESLQTFTLTVIASP